MSSIKYNSAPGISLTLVDFEALRESQRPAQEPWSVTATAEPPSSFVVVKRSFGVHRESPIEKVV
jgi:hypothetical protein